MKKIKLLTDWDTFKAGVILEVDEGTCATLIESKTAELYEAVTVMATEPEPTVDAAQAAVIADIVKQALQAAKDAEPKPENKAAVVTNVRPRVLDDPRLGFRSFADHVKAVRDACTGQGMDERLKAVSGMSEGVDADGGFLVPPEFRAELMRKTYESAQVLNRCRRLPMTSTVVGIPYIAESSRANGSRSGGVRVYRTAEGGDKTGSAPKFGKVELKLEKMTALVYATDELLSDSVITMDALINELVSEEFAFVIDDEIIEGTGAGQCLGILNAPAIINTAIEGGQLADTIESANIVNMWSRLYARGRSNAVWYINQDIEPQLQQMTLGVGASPQVTYMPPGGLSGAPYATLMGRPVIAIEQCSTLGDRGDIILADMSQYLFGEKTSGMEVATSIHYRFINDETTFRFVMRNDGQPWWASALTPFKGSATTSPFVTLAARA